jgi:hypothetical protein
MEGVKRMSKWTVPLMAKLRRVRQVTEAPNPQSKETPLQVWNAWQKEIKRKEAALRKHQKR